VLDDTTIREFLRDDYQKLVNVVSFVTGDLSSGEELIQEALVRALIRSDRGEEIDPLRAWVSAEALNLSRSPWRRLAIERRARARAGKERVEADDAADEERLVVERALAALPRRQREVAVLRYFLRMSVQEVADTLGVSEGTVENCFAKARVSLGTSLHVDDEGENDAGA
jgi:RNA polymerase sigma-70 factor (ECF subfamily)